MYFFSFALAFSIKFHAYPTNRQGAVLAPSLGLCCGVKSSLHGNALPLYFVESPRFNSAPVTFSNQRKRITERCSFSMQTVRGSAMLTLQQKEEKCRYEDQTSLI
ncbi:hypothetical protein AVEN_195638-1 [Araneus ventricosus]|uniref:Uncharacterized protein n=1 Tax=Araneus ventricosus TaxID=182803 RepID=A0A4Y2B9B4_ARAVE|nr:hypothetical protein AVEN_195638-1 [Araneus ventricosus]